MNPFLTDTTVNSRYKHMYVTEQKIGINIRMGEFMLDLYLFV